MKEYRNEQGRLHRDNGPAIEHKDRYSAWFQHGKCHRFDGPAIEFADGTREWYLYDRDITDEVESWIKERDFIVPFDKQTQVLFLLRFG